ncbi:MAG: PEP-CTERM sorting domain-containing protein [Ferribacterium limneticum]
MRHTFTPITCAVALGLGMLATGAHASVASPILSVSNVVTSSSNLGAGATTTTSGPTVTSYANGSNTPYSTTTSSAFTSEVQTAPTATTAGLVYDYETVTTTKSWDHQTWKNDYLSIGVTSDGTNQSGGKWISLTGSVQSSIATSLSFNLSASGNFTAAQTPFGATAPLLASFYFGGALPTPLSANTYSDLEQLSYDTYSTSYSTMTFNLLAGVAQNFVAYVYAPTDVSVDTFQLSANTDNYDFVSTSQSLVNIGPKTLIGAQTLAPIPEPASYAMLLAGVGIIGLMARRRKQAR